jgi:hypothetical protein
MAYRPRRKKNGLDPTTILLLLGVGGAALYAVSASAAPKVAEEPVEDEDTDVPDSDVDDDVDDDAEPEDVAPPVIQGPATTTSESDYTDDLTDPNFAFIIVKAQEGGTLFLNDQAVFDVGPINETRFKLPAPGAYQAYVRFLDGAPSATKTIGVIPHSVANWYFSRDNRENVASQGYAVVAASNADATKAAAYAMLGEADSLMKQKQYANALKKLDDIVLKYPATSYAKSAQVIKALLTIQLKARQKIEGVK